MTVCIDTREQHPWRFPEGVKTVRATLMQGDYALEGDGSFAIERKNALDFRQTVAGKAAAWERFTRELARMDAAGTPQKVIVVEGDMASYLFRETAAGIKEPEVECDPVLLMHRVAELAVRYRCCVLFARDAGTAAAMAWHLFCVRLEQVKGGQKK